MGFRLTVILASAIAAAPGALAQAFEPPPFEALDVQRQQTEQQQLDALEKQKRDEIFRSSPDPFEASRSALRRMEIESRQDAVRLQGALERDAVRRQETVREWTLPNRRIAASSVLVVEEPAQYGMPPAPRGQYYARVDGRFVLVDAASELIVTVVPVQPADPVRDVPLPPAAPPPPPLPQAIPGAAP